MASEVPALTAGMWEEDQVGLGCGQKVSEVWHAQFRPSGDLDMELPRTKGAFGCGTGEQLWARERCGSCTFMGGSWSNGVHARAQEERIERGDKAAEQGCTGRGQTPPFSSYLSWGLPTSLLGPETASYILWRREVLRMRGSLLLRTAMSFPPVPRLQWLTIFLINEHADKSLGFSLAHSLLGRQHPPLSFHGWALPARDGSASLTRHDGTAKTR